MTTMSKPAAKPNVAVEAKREGSTYYKTLVRSGYAPVNGLEMYYEIHGTVSARQLVTIHPFAGLANVFPSLTRNRQLITVELQGHGRTADIDRPLSFEQEADDVAALVKHLGISEADFFGESFGGIVAVLLAVRYPELVRRVAIYGSALGKLEEVSRPESLAELMSLTPDHSSVQFQRESYKRWHPIHHNGLHCSPRPPVSRGRDFLATNSHQSKHPSWSRPAITMFWAPVSNTIWRCPGLYQMLNSPSSLTPATSC